jgi:iduronate 2-sulfatase
MKYFISNIIFLFVIINLSAVEKTNRYNVLFIISDDLTATALSCYGNKVCQTPNIDSLAEQGTLYTRSYCQATYCGPSRASFMSGYYPSATKVLGYVSGRKAIGDRETWTEYFKNKGYHTARVSKIFHMGVPIGIEKGTDGSDDERSWSERFNSQGPEWRAPGKGETLEGNPDGKKPVVGGNTFVVVEADGDDLVHSDGRTAQKAAELLTKYKKANKPFFLGVGFVRPHVPFVAPKSYYKPFVYDEMILPKKLANDWADIPKAGINYKTSKNMKMDLRRQKKAVGGYYASVAYMDAMVGKVLKSLKDNNLEKNTIVIFTSDHGYHLGEHDFWAKVSLLEESTRVPLIIKVPGKKAAICHSFVELLDLFPTTAALCGLKIPARIQGKNITATLEDSQHQVRSGIFCNNKKGLLYRDDKWAYIEYGERKKKGAELYDMLKDPKQFTNLVNNPEYASVLREMKAKMAAKLAEVRNNDLGISYK